MLLSRPIFNIVTRESTIFMPLQSNFCIYPLEEKSLTKFMWIDARFPKTHKFDLRNWKKSCCQRRRRAPCVPLLNSHYRFFCVSISTKLFHFLLFRAPKTLVPSLPSSIYFEDTTWKHDSFKFETNCCFFGRYLSYHPLDITKDLEQLDLKRVSVLWEQFWLSIFQKQMSSPSFPHF